MTKSHVRLGAYQPAVDAALAEMTQQRIMARIWRHDHTVWKPDPTGITNRLGWLHIAKSMTEYADSLSCNKIPPAAISATTNSVPHDSVAREVKHAT